MGQSRQPYEDFEQIDAILADLECDVSAAEFHGLTSGLIAGGLQPTVQQWLDTLSVHLDFQQDPAETDRNMLYELYKHTYSQLAEKELNFEFNLVLPEDEFPLVDRLDALGQWCRGFVEGIGLSEVGDILNESEESQEILRDLVAISQIDVESGAEGEEGEGQYTELVEYVRISSLNLYSNLGLQKIATQQKAEQKSQEEGDSSQSDNETLH